MPKQMSNSNLAMMSLLSCHVDPSLSLCTRTYTAGVVVFLQNVGENAEMGTSDVNRRQLTIGQPRPDPL
ncbi:hypothetical protein NEOLEDRAFT_1135869 [Neolentinus lepideus HHB14362 ss-1]|uniref:Uncharacterized protein n=1 Tax=Neolentinus lepideus HHB14362 ss-1 TaxID=1314782 RepID=A0A165RG51_9AGAM|nr:hypothetical protein NEOLEDRAFT_1135869 [Neolentinus lepideus HHB14362 ss-1]